jgi:selenocysteine-specific elongation factor
MRVIGTAGHVDHGKSALVEALTGTHPDRLKEERERSMTIDLGFAWLTLPGATPAAPGEEVGIIDVPGHRDFIENMLAGIGGIDAVLFVVAADEGVMPQTREHLAILDLLQIPGGVVALTKIDLVDDPAWLDLVEEDLQRALAGTVLARAPVVRVSARSRAGLPQLLQALAVCLAERPPRPDLGRPRLPVDRVFTVAGFGTVVTGTLTDGFLRVGEEVELLPAQLHGRVRGLQTHKRKEEEAVPGSRTAVNISGIDLDQVRRGDVLVHPGTYQSTRRLDVRFRLLADASRPLEHNTEVKLFAGAAEVLARLRLLGSERLRPGETGWLQLELQAPLVAVRGDRYILRRPSPGETLGGGAVVDPQPRRRHKRFAAEVVARLEALAGGTPSELVVQAALTLGAAPLSAVFARAGLEAAAAAAAAADLLAAGDLLALESNGMEAEAAIQPGDLVIARSQWQGLVRQALQEVEAYHRLNPLRRGMPREELKSRLKLAPRMFNAVLRRLVNEARLAESGPLVLHPEHQIHFTPAQERAAQQLLARFRDAPYAPPSVKEAQAEVGEAVFGALLELGSLVAVSPEVVFEKAGYEHMLAEVRRLLAERGTLTAAELRDHFNTSRRYVLALLEHLDVLGITVRAGDARRLK